MLLKKNVSIKIEDDDFEIVKEIEAINKVSGLGVRDIVLKGIETIKSGESYQNKLKQLKEV